MQKIISAITLVALTLASCNSAIKDERKGSINSIASDIDGLSGSITLKSNLSTGKNYFNLVFSNSQNQELSFGFSSCDSLHYSITDDAIQKTAYKYPNEGTACPTIPAEKIVLNSISQKVIENQLIFIPNLKKGSYTLDIQAVLSESKSSRKVIFKSTKFSVK